MYILYFCYNSRQRRTKKYQSSTKSTSASPDTAFNQIKHDSGGIPVTTANVAELAKADIEQLLFAAGLEVGCHPFH